jgi:hypothetical protein
MTATDVGQLQDLLLGCTPAQREAIEKIMALDLEPIVYTLTIAYPGEEPQMTLAEADAAVVLYRRHLILNVLRPDLVIVPPRSADEVWHTHILDTAKYAEDMLAIFDFFLHHFPYLGRRGHEDEADWQAAYAVTCDLHEQLFGSRPPAATAGSCPSTGGACYNGHCGEEQTGVMRPRPDRSARLVPAP